MLAANLFAADWGDFKGTVTYGGEAPAATKVAVTKDVEFCGKHNLVNEALVVNPDDQGVANVIVYMYLKKSDDAPPIHESYQESAEAEVPFDNLNCTFSPRVVLLRTTQKLVIGNKDPVGHNTKITCLENGEMNPIVPGESQLDPKQFPAVERLPVDVSCSIHPWMKGYLVVKDNPYFAVTDENGRFEIKNVPAGDWVFQFWHEESGYLNLAEAAIDGGDLKVKSMPKKAQKDLKKGRLAVAMTSAGYDIGSAVVPAAVFDK